MCSDNVCWQGVPVEAEAVQEDAGERRGTTQRWHKTGTRGLLHEYSDSCMKRLARWKICAPSHGVGYAMCMHAD